jgi:opacity protein-like surface antigen
MKKFILLIILFYSSASFAQISVKCNVVNDKGASVPYSIAYCINNNSGVAANGNGEITIEVEHQTDSIRFSMLGYNPLVKTAADLSNNSTVVLSTRVYVLEEAVVAAPKSQYRYKSLIEGGNSFVMDGHSGSILLVKIYAPEHAGKVISKILAQTASMTGVKNELLNLRVRVYAIGANGFPDYDLLTQTIDVAVGKKQKLIEADISACNIALPKSGVFVGFEWLPREQTKIDKTRKAVGPFIATTKMANEELTVFGSIKGDDWKYLTMEDAPFFISKRPRNAKIGVEFQ